MANSDSRVVCAVDGGSGASLQANAVGMLPGMGRAVLVILATIGGFCWVPLWLFVVSFWPLVIGLMMAVLGIAGLPNTWPRLLWQELLVIRFSQPLTMAVANGIRAAELVVPPVIFHPSRWLYKYLPQLCKVLFVGEPELIAPPELQPESTDHSGEAWFVLNGVCTTRSMAEGNVATLFKMFGRPVTAIFNPTDSVLLDLAECIAGKMLREDFYSKPRQLTVDALRRALLDESNKKVVFIAHSQGTIIASNALADLNAEAARDQRLGGAMHKLEVFLLATCSQRLVVGRAGHVESLCNEWDTVAMLGALCPASVRDAYGRDIKIEGEVIIEAGKYGHMLITHYLSGLATGHYAGSRLHAYLRGA